MVQNCIYSDHIYIYYAYIKCQCYSYLMQFCAFHNLPLFPPPH